MVVRNRPTFTSPSLLRPTNTNILNCGSNYIVDTPFCTIDLDFLCIYIKTFKKIQKGRNKKIQIKVKNKKKNNIMK